MRAASAPDGAGWSMRLLGMLIAAAVSAGISAGIARAEGSAQLYPATAACVSNASGGSCRANIEWRTSSYGPATGAQVRRRTYLQVYAAAGEQLLMGSSAVAVGAGDIVVYDPGVVTDTDADPLPPVTTGVNGFRCSDQRAGSGIAAQGRITTRAQELAGAQAVSGGGNPTGYVPCSYAAPVSGVYGIAFYGPSGAAADVDGGVTGETGLASAANFDASQATSVAAWDVTVRSDATSATDLTGRLFTKALVAYTAGNGRPINLTVHVVTSDGFRYRTDARGLDPNGFAFFGNQFGFLDGDGASPLYHDAYGTTNTGQLTALAGGVTFAAPAFPIFLAAPDPATLTALGIPLTATAPAISSLSFTGNVSGSTSSIGAGGTFTYTGSTAGVYELVISRDGVDFDPGAAQNRVLRGVRAAGPQSVVWDGKDNSGADFPVGTNYAVRASLHAGEYHFPMVDAENSTLGGPTFTLLNPPGGVCPHGSCTTAFFDDRGYRTVGPGAAFVGTPPPPDTPLCGAGAPASPYHSDPVNGFDTSGPQRAFGSDTGGNSNTPCGGSFGDVKGLDMWTFYPSSTAAGVLDIVSSADLSLGKAHTGSFVAGQNGTYTLTVANAGVVASGAITLHDPLPAGLSFVSGSGAGWACGSIGPAVTCTRAAGLAPGGSSTVTMTIAVSTSAAAAVTNTASVSAVVFDPDQSDNSASDATTVIPVPVAHDDATTTGPATPVSLAVLGNDDLGAAPTTITTHSVADHGSVTCSATECTYVPGAGFSGTDAFAYTITDANGRVATAIVTITVTPPPPDPADLATVVHGLATVAAGATASLTADVHDNGPGFATRSHVTLSLPAGFSPRAGTITIDGAPAGAACTVAGRVITCQLGTLTRGSSVRISWIAAVGASAHAGSYVVRSHVTSATPDPVLQNNPSAWTIRVVRPPRDVDPPELQVSITTTPGAVHPGDELRTTVLLHNAGGTAVPRAVVCLPPPPGMAFAAAPGAVYRQGSACWVVADVAPGSSTRFVVVLRADTTARPGTVRVSARVAVTGNDDVRWARATIRILGGRPAGRPDGVTG